VQVTAGTVVYEAPLSLRASATGASSTLAGIGRLVAAAQARRQPLAQAHPSQNGCKRGAMLMPVTQIQGRARDITAACTGHAHVSMVQARTGAGGASLQVLCLCPAGDQLGHNVHKVAQY
jgi:hypothetical protein